MLSWIPLLGPILQGLFNIVGTVYSKFKDTQLGMRVQDVEEEKVAQQIVQTNSAYIGYRILTEAVCAPVCIWTMLVTWDTIVALRYPELMWHVASFEQTSVPYLPYAVLMFLLGSIGINSWNRK